MLGVEFYFDSSNVTVSVVDNKDNSDLVTIKFTPPPQFRDNTHSKEVAITRRSGRRLVIKIEGLTKVYD